MPMKYCLMKRKEAFMMKEEKKLLMVVRTLVGSIPQWIFLTCSLAQGMDIPEHVKNVKERI